MNRTSRFPYFIIIVLALISIFKTLFALSAPLPQAKKQKQLLLTGYRVVPLVAGPVKRGRDFSFGPSQQFELHDKATGRNLLLLIIPIRSRNEKALQMARMPEFEPKFFLRQRHLRLLSSAIGQELKITQRQEVAMGQGPRTDHAPVVRLQSCLMPGGRAAVTTASIQEHLYHQRNAELARAPFQGRLSRFFGLEPNTRWECLAIQLESPDTPGAETSLLKAWAGVAQILWTGLKPP